MFRHRRSVALRFWPEEGHRNPENGDEDGGGWKLEELETQPQSKSTTQANE